MLPTENRRLFVTDLDGTLLNRDSRVSDESARIISMLSRRGVMITVATARTPATVDTLLKDTIVRVPAIVMTGAAIWDKSTCMFVDKRVIPDDIAAYVIDVCRRWDLRPFSYTVSDSGIVHTYFNGTPDAKERKFISERSHLRLKRIHIDDPRTEGLRCVSGTVLLFCIGCRDRIDSAAAELRESGLCSASAYPDIFSPDMAYLEVFAPGVSKASALLRLKEMTGAESVTVFGDNLNDLSMMEAADMAVAVGNALPQVKEAADVVIDNNDSDSVARYILEVSKTAF